MSFRIAAWNVNSINARLPTVLAVLEAITADVICLQELKCEDAKFPRPEIEAAGYNVQTHGQKTYNGVAILSKHRIEEVAARLPGDDTDEQARYLEAVIAAPKGPVRVASLYCPNGNPVGTEKFAYKLAWMNRLEAKAKALLSLEEPLVLAGDFNIIPRLEDCYDPNAWAADALFQPESRAAYRRLANLGFTDAYIQADARAHQYTFWDYQAGAWPKDHGIRIDHLMCSPQAADRLKAVGIHRAARALEKPSDHVPIWADFDL
ncbi:MAG: exodeoxyribonuclease III [Caulobacterales bacterium]